MFKKLQKLDYWILVPFAVLSALGIVMVFSASQSSAIINFIKQLIFVVIGCMGAFFFFHMNLNVLRGKKILERILWIIIVSLLLARFAFPPVNGAHGWMNFGLITIQPAEFLKLALILYFADYLSKNPWNERLRIRSQQIIQFSAWRWPAAALVLVIFMPDNGNAMITLMILLVILLASGISRLWGATVVALFSLGFAILPTLIKLVVPASYFNNTSQHYAVSRLINFVNPWENPDASRQLLYGYYAIAHGGLFGVGLGNSLIKPYLPESNTDFIMAIFGEEMGAIATIAVLVLMLILIVRIILIGIRASQQYHRLMMFGIATLLFMQTFVNLGGVIGLLPITGVVFPFISGGGSSYIVMSAAVGMSLNIAAHQKKLVRAHRDDIIARKERL